MKKIVFAAIAVVSSFAGLAQSVGPVAGTATKGEQRQKMLPPGKMREIVEKKMGGFIIDRRVQKGRVVIVNAQDSAKEDWLKNVAADFEKDSRIAFAVEKGPFDIKNPAPRGEVCVFVIDDDKLPMSLLATESGWAAVNVAKLRTEKEQFFSARVRKEIVRVLGFMLGSADSQYPMALTGAVKTANDLDEIMAAKLPFDVMMRIERSSEKLGIKPFKPVTYKQACKEGWAPAPTNEYQKAIWEATLKLPEKPMTIEFDPKKDK